MKSLPYNLSLFLICCIVAIMLAVQHFFVYDDNIYYIGNAVSWVLAMLTALILIKGTIRKIIVGYGLALTLINLAHELFGKPTEFEQWQYYVHLAILFAFVVLIGMNYKKLKKP